MQKEILIRAYININLGDDIFIKMLCDRYANHQFYLIAPSTKTQPFKNIKNLKIINTVPYIDGIFRKLRINFEINQHLSNYLSRKCDGVIHIGGSIFIESKNDWNKKINRYENSINNSNHFFVIGSNFGPYNDPNFLKRYNQVFKKIDDICFRDEYSYSKFSNLPNVRLAPDIVFSLNTSNVEEYVLEKDEYIVISVIDLSWRDELKVYTDIYENSIITIAKELIKLGKKVVLMSFCKSQGDEDAINRIMKKYPSKDVLSYLYDGNISESLSVLKSSTGIVATRFHSLILGWVFNKPVFPFEYSSKTTNLLKDIEYNGYHLPINKLTDMNIHKVTNQLMETNSQDIKYIRREAERQFLKTDDFLEY